MCVPAASNCKYGTPQAIALVSLCLTLVFFVLEVHRAREIGIDVGPENHVVVGALGATTMAFVLSFFVPGGPADQGSAWVITFSLHSLVAGVLTLIWVILGSEEGAGAAELHAQAIASIVLAAVTFPLLLYNAVHFYISDILDLKNNLKRMLCVISLLLTIVSFTCWLTAGDHITAEWVHGVFIAGSLTAAIAAIDGLFIGNEISFTFNSIIGAVLSAIFFIATSVEIPPGQQNAKLLVAIIFAAINCCILFFMGQQGKKGAIKEKSLLELILIGIALLTVVQFSIAMGVEQVNTTVSATGITWQYSILCWGAASIFAALFFAFIHFDHNARGIHVLMGLVGYVIFFVADCVEASKYSEANVANAVVTTETTRAYRVRITALVAAAANCLLLLIATVLTFPHVQATEEIQADDAAEPEEAEA